jgi:hypothetical protein
MFASRALNALQAAIEAEKHTIDHREAAYMQLAIRMLHYQGGKGAAPSVEEFEDWLAAASTRVAVAKCRDGLE